MLRDNNISVLHLIRTKLFEEKTYKRDIKRFNRQYKLKEGIISG